MAQSGLLKHKLNRIKILSLNEKKDVWAETLLDMRVEDRAAGTQNVRNAGYDVLEEANKLERFYVEASAR